MGNELTVKELWERKQELERELTRLVQEWNRKYPPIGNVEYYPPNFEPFNTLNEASVVVTLKGQLPQRPRWGELALSEVGPRQSP